VRNRPHDFLKSFIMKLHGLITGIAFTLIAALLPAPPARADDIDIFIDSASGAGAPNLVFLLDNTSNFSKASQAWGPPDNEPTQGQAELDAIFTVIQQIYDAKQRDASAPAVRIGVAMLNSNGNPGGAYFRFAPRDITIPANFVAFKNIFGYGKAGVPAAGVASTAIYTKINNPNEKINESSKDESGALYEIYKYFNALPAFKGAASKNPYADYPGSPNVPQTPAGQGLTSSFALDSAGTRYIGPENTCAHQYIVYIANNSQGNQISSGFSSYEGVSAGPAIPPIGYSPDFWTDEWVRFLSQHQITTYILDAFNAQQNVSYSAELKAAAGNDRYYQVGSEAAIIAALNRILTDVQAVNSAFAATSMPASAANRSISQNEVFLGVFRPGEKANPRWYGNLKRYQLLYNDATGDIDLGDAFGASAINPASGFMAECSASYWTSDSTTYQPSSSVAAQPYWAPIPGSVPPSSLCPAPGSSGGAANPASNLTFPLGVAWSPLSDLPDGPFVEKGGAAEILRRGNIANATTATWQVNRVTKTLSGSSLVDFTATTPGVSLQGLGAPSGTTTPNLGQLVDYVRGWDSKDTNANGYTDPNAPSASIETRPTIHGDVIHSTPLPITYNSTADGVVVYYGSNDGMYHALNAGSGTERWAFLAPEFFPRMYRQYANEPVVRYPNIAPGISPTPQPKDYFFDGATGVYQSSDGKKVYIYPSMRRGGRMIYAFDVSPVGGAAPATPRFLWKAGCPDLSSDTGCTAGMSGIGQTWSKPVSGLIRNGALDTAPAPVVVFGGGYDSTPTRDANGKVIATSCEDQNAKSPACASRKGNRVYIVDAEHGPATLLRSFALAGADGRTPGSVAGDVALLDANSDGFVDYAYLADTNGFVYRIDFVDGPSTLVPLAQDDWSIHQVAGSSGFGRKFLFEPTLFFNRNKVYVGLGSGDREHPLINQYPYTAPVQNRFYVFIDDPAATDAYLDLDGDSMADASSDGLAADGTATGEGATCATPAVLASTSETASGWYLPQTAHGVGEQVVTPAVIVSGQVTWGTNRPLPPTAGTCTNSLGEARGYLVDLVNGSGAIGISGVCGGATSSPYTGGGLPIPPDINVARLIDKNGQPIYVGTCIGCPAKNDGAAAGSGTQPVSNFKPTDPFDVKSEARRRVYWFTPGGN
jgi:Tfp pilus tip-associated adhesin PilY1